MRTRHWRTAAADPGGCGATRLHEYLRASQRPLLAVWGRGDEIFGPDGARVFATDSPGAEIHLLDGGWFLLESKVDEVAGLMRSFLGKQSW